MVNLRSVETPTHIILPEESLNYESIRGKLAQQTLKETEDRFTVLFEKSPLAIAFTAPNGQFLEVNEKFCKFLNYERNDLLLLRFQDVMNIEDRKLGSFYASRLLRNEVNAIQHEKHYQCRDGRMTWIRVHTFIERFFGGRAKYFLTFIEELNHGVSQPVFFNQLQPAHLKGV